MSSPEDRVFQIVCRIEDKLDRHIETHDNVHDEIEKDIRVRPTRSELLQTLGGAGVLSGIVFGIIKLV